MMIFHRTFYYDAAAAEAEAARLRTEGRKATVQRRYSNGYVDVFAEPAPRPAATTTTTTTTGRAP